MSRHLREVEPAFHRGRASTSKEVRLVVFITEKAVNLALVFTAVLNLALPHQAWSFAQNKHVTIIWRVCADSACVLSKCCSGARPLTKRPFLTQVAQSIEDHHQEVIGFCRENGFHGLVAYDSDYALCNIPYYFSAHALKLSRNGKSLTTSQYLMHEVAKQLDLNPNRFPIFAALLGNHILPDEDLASFHWSLLGPEHPLASLKVRAHQLVLPPCDVVIKAVADYVRNIQDTSDLDAIAKDVFQHSQPAHGRGGPASLLLQGLSVCVARLWDLQRDRLRADWEVTCPLPTQQGTFGISLSLLKVMILLFLALNFTFRREGFSPGRWPLAFLWALLAPRFQADISCPGSELLPAPQVPSPGAPGQGPHPYSLAEPALTLDTSGKNLTEQNYSNIPHEGKHTPLYERSSPINPAPSGSPNHVDSAYFPGSSTSSSSDNDEGGGGAAKNHMDITTPPLPPVAPEVLRVAEHRHKKGLMYPYIFHVLTKSAAGPGQPLPRGPAGSLSGLGRCVLRGRAQPRFLPCPQLCDAAVALLAKGCSFICLCVAEARVALCSRRLRLSAEPILGALRSYIDEMKRVAPCRRFVNHVTVHHAVLGTVSPVIIKEWAAYKGKSPQTPELVEALAFREWTCPNLKRLWLGKAVEDKNRRMRAFLACMRSDTPAMLNPASVPTHLTVLCCVLRYMVQWPGARILRRQELDAFLAQALSPKLYEPDQLQELKIENLDPRGIQLSALFMSGVDMALFANDACGQPVPWEHCCPWMYFDGKLFQSKLLKASREKTPLIDLCDGQAEQAAKVEKMRQSILEGLNFSRQSHPLPFPPPAALPFYPASVYPRHFGPIPPAQGRGRGFAGVCGFGGPYGDTVATGAYRAFRVATAAGHCGAFSGSDSSRTSKSQGGLPSSFAVARPCLPAGAVACPHTAPLLCPRPPDHCLLRQSRPPRGAQCRPFPSVFSNKPLAGKGDDAGVEDSKTNAEFLA
ncbi:hypothetical protein CB1_000303013 [Camelus ferus]|nr:hypothetical protein CB1_000303013 [Camelus ferus]